MVSNHWRPIEDLPDDWEAFARPDLDQMLRLWNDERQHLNNPGRVHELEERLATLWAIETGVIERLYTIDRGTTESLVELGLGAIEQFSSTGRINHDAARLIEDQRAALDFVFSYIKDDRPLTLSYIRELHQLLMRNQTHIDAVDSHGNRFQAEPIRGAWKRLPNNPTTADGSIHEYAPPDFVQDEMDQLIAMHERHVAAGIRPEIEAAWLHHRFAQIHPFQDGNGRVARALATMVFLKAGFVPLVIRDDDHRERYLDALRTADDGDLGPLVSLFANVVSNDLNDAITFVRTMHGRTIKAIAGAAAEAAKRRAIEEQEELRSFSIDYTTIAVGRLEEISAELEAAFASAFPDIRAPFASTGIGGERELDETESQTWWKSKVSTAFQVSGTGPDLPRISAWALLHLPKTQSPNWEWIVVGFTHADSRAGTMNVTVYLASGSDPATEGPPPNQPEVLTSRPGFTYGAGPVQEDRFRAWLDAALTTALEEWQARI